MRRLVVLLTLALVGRTAAADQSGTEAKAPSRGLFEPPTMGSLEVSLKAGGHFSQLVNPLGTNFDGILKVGYGVAAEKRLQVFVDLGYSQPAHQTSSSDPRFGSGGESYESTIRVRDLSTTLGAQYFIPAPLPVLLPYAGAGIQLHFIRSVVEGGAMSSFGRNDETNTRVGGTVFAGVCSKLGPGLLLGELRFGYAGVTDKLTGTSNIGALSLLIGYGLMF